MTEEQNKFSKGQKIWIISGIVIFIVAIGYQLFRVFSKDTVTGDDISNLTMMGVMFIGTLVMMRPGLKRW